MPPSVIIFGPPGAPVAELAEALGRRLGVPVGDTDVQLAEAAGEPVGELLVEIGEEEFRRRERFAVVAALARDGGVQVIGGGAVLHPETRIDLARAVAEGCTTVFVDVGLAEAARRLGWAGGATVVINPRAQWLSMMAGRREIYRRCATFTVEGGVQVTAAVQQLVNLVGSVGLTPEPVEGA